MRRVILVVSLWVCLAPLASAELKGRERESAKEMTAGSLYLRNNVPCRYTSGSWGIGAVVVTEVSPTAVDWEKNLKAVADANQTKKKKRGVDTIYWGFGPNDVIRYGKLYFKGDNVELWAEGVKPKDTEIWIRFVEIKSLDDFKKAFDQILSNKPLQDEHPEWPAGIKEAVAGRKVVEGMTKAQAFAVVGTPIGVETSEEGGKKVETWFPRQETGASGSWGRVLSATTGFPASLRFMDGLLVTIGQGANTVKVSLDK